MGKWGCSLLLLLTAAQAQAAWQCQVKPQDDIIISAQQVQIVGASGNLQISRDGAVTRDGHPLALSAVWLNTADSTAKVSFRRRRWKPMTRYSTNGRPAASSVATPLPCVPEITSRPRAAR